MLYCLRLCRALCNDVVHLEAEMGRLKFVIQHMHALPGVAVTWALL